MKRLVVALMVLLGCASSVAGQAANQQPALEAPDPGATEAVYEAVVRFQVASWQLGADSYCIQIKGKDADEKMLRSLKPLDVKPESECLKVKKKYDMVVIDKHSKKRSVIFGAGNIRWTSDTSADIEGGYLCGSQCMSGGVYHAVKEDGQWKVIKFDTLISN
jgi:hypothetical protein